MAQFEEVLFILQFIFLIGIFFYKLFNILNGWSLYDWKGIIVLFISTLFLFGIDLIVTPLAYENLFISQLSKLEILPFLLIVIFSFIEAITMVQAQLSGRPRYSGVENGRR